MIDPKIRDRALGAYLGLACGDALGATVEFMTKSEIAREYGIHRHIKGGGWLRLSPGQVTDDTEMSVWLGRAIIKSAGWDLKLVADCFAEWLRGVPADVGDTTRRGIRGYMIKGEIEAPLSETSAGNGAAMRNLPVALSTLGDDAAFIQRSLEQSHITHNNPLSDAAVLCLGRMVRRLIQGGGIKDCREEANRLVAAHKGFRFTPYSGLSTAYIIDTIQTVFHFYFRTDSIESCIVETVNQGGDADTTGAIAGMLAGATYGAKDLPPRWLRKLDPQVRTEIERQTDLLLALSPACRTG
ncbi:ADP-ribosyl-(dinitrogen reductase) glycohydrolase [Skermanella stibiiresistens SB22]|uniref:ADP-ribosyl-(Dinitrogen reductase) glycohydrolase n=1 Tax=Skermanella stibiiresistens SB22 TaxID=1385369 RepID=W9H6P2_9PROT|nr:ADP-ribosyl-[dinitrogen reductase] hydrolase [Skermanella stibiiresistens]EWY39443.1 ADP-ribosyl-(dinitrogen reductase) glycohydrolase [Skermanella stibiiresistens SB22]